jgi:hypothetical protein
MPSDLDLALSTFHQVEWATIIEEIDQGKSHGQILRRMIREGQTLSESERTYQQVTSDLDGNRRDSEKLRMCIARMRLSNERRQQEERERWKKEHSPEGIEQSRQLALQHQNEKMMGKLFENLATEAAKRVIGALLGIRT